MVCVGERGSVGKLDYLLITLEIVLKGEAIIGEGRGGKVVLEEGVS